MRQIETVGLRKVEAKLGGRRMATVVECYSGRKCVKVNGVVHRIPVEGHGIVRRKKPPTPRDVINARCLEALREMTADGRYVTATAVAEAIGIGGARRRFRSMRWPGKGRCSARRIDSDGAGGVSRRGRCAMANDLRIVAWMSHDDATENDPPNVGDIGGHVEGTGWPEYIDTWSDEAKYTTRSSANTSSRIKSFAVAIGTRPKASLFSRTEP